MNSLGGVLGTLIVLVLWRWSWLRGVRRKLSRRAELLDTKRFAPQRYIDEADQTYHGRVIKRLRARVIEGRVEVDWQYHAGFAHRGFVLTARCRRNDGDWQPLAMEPFQDSGSWVECFNLGESRSYLFTVKKTYHFFFGLFGEQPDEVVHDQISFSVRKGKYLKEKGEIVRDHANLARETMNYAKLSQEFRAMMNPRPASTPSISAAETKAEKLERRRKVQREIADYIDAETAKINAHADWSDERKEREIEQLHEMAAEQALED